MKNLFFVQLVAYLLFINETHAQFPCNYQISTNPENSINEQILINPVLAPFKNEFSWYANDGFSSYSDIPFVNMGTPPNTYSGFFPSPYDPAAMGVYLPELHDGGVNEKSFLPQDGWELISVNLGYYPNLDVLPNGSLVSEVPYFLLYNKYRNILRLFATTTLSLATNVNNFQSVRVTLGFSNSDNISGLFNTVAESIVPLDRITDVKQVSSFVVNASLNNPKMWFHVDFPVAYDPCGCYFRSDLRVKLEFFNAAQVTLSGRLVGLNEPVLDSQGKPLDTKTFLASLYTDDAVETGVMIYKRQLNLIDDYLAKLSAIQQQNIAIGKYNDEIKRKKAILEAYKLVLTKTPIGSVLLATLQNVASELFIGLDLLNPNNSEDNKAFNSKVEKVAQTILGEGYSRLKASFKPKETLAEPDMPLAFLAEMAFTGAITQDADYPLPPFFNPGTYPNPSFASSTLINHLNYPAYNNALGSFAVLNTPKVYKARNQTVVGSAPFLLCYYPTGCQTDILSIIRFKSSYRIMEPINFVFNPNLDINFSKTTILAAMELIPPQNFSFIEDGGDLTCYDSNPEICPIQHFNFNPNYTTERKGDLISEFVPLECLYEMISSFDYSYPDDQNVFSSNDHQQMFNRFTDESLRIRLIINYEFNAVGSNGEPIRSTEIYTIPVEIIEPNDPNVFSVFETSYNLNDYEQHIVIGDEQFTTNTTIHASKTVVLNGNITVADGVTVNIFAGEEISQMPENSIITQGTGVLNLSIVPVLECQDPAAAAQVSPTYVHNFCNGNLPEGNYMANITTRAFKPNTNTELIRELDLRVASVGSGFYHLASYNAADNNRQFRLFDANGRLLLQGNELPASLDMNTYASGMYIIEFSTENGFSRRKLAHY